MKGLQERNDDGIFLVIKHGGICQESKTPREGFAPIEVTNPRSGATTTKYIKRYRGVEATIKRIEWYDREFDNTPFQGWKLILDANGTGCSLDLPFESRVGTRFAKLAENIDFSQPVEFSAWKGSDEKTAFSVKQNGVNVPQKYTREDPGECPAPVQGFNKKWNFDAQKQFLHERMTQIVIPRLQALNGHSGATADTAETSHDAESVPQENFSEAKVKLLKRIKRLLPQINHDEAKHPELLTTYFGTSIWAEIERLDETALEACLEKMEDSEIPF